MTDAAPAEAPAQIKAKVLDHEFIVTNPYAEGHVCTAAEAKALGQLRRENIANIMRAQVKAAIAGGEGAPTIEEVGEAWAKKDAEYQFTLGSSGGRRSTMTDEEKEAMALAKAWLREQLAANGKTLKQYTEEKTKEGVEAKLAEIAEAPAIAKKAAANVKARAKTASETLGVEI